MSALSLLGAGLSAVTERRAAGAGGVAALVALRAIEAIARSFLFDFI